MAIFQHLDNSSTRSPNLRFISDYGDSKHKNESRVDVAGAGELLPDRADELPGPGPQIWPTLPEVHYATFDHLHCQCDSSDCAHDHYVFLKVV